MTDTATILNRVVSALDRAVAFPVSMPEGFLVDAVRDLVEVVRRQQAEINALRTRQANANFHVQTFGRREG